jgi:hypothetical protein
VPETVDTDTDSDSEDEDTPQVSSTWLVHEEELHYFDAVDSPDDLPQFTGRPVTPEPDIPPPPPEPPPEQHDVSAEETGKARKFTHKEPDYSTLQRFFGWQPIENIKKTFQKTTQLARLTVGTLLKQAYRAPNPALNVWRRNEPVATDTLYSDVPAIDCGATMCQVFVGCHTDVTDIPSAN